MNKSKFSNNITKLATEPQARERYKLSRNKLRELAEQENAVFWFGRSIRYDVTILDAAIRNYGR